jgi:CRISPR-associated endonuclease/helicase Cas3
MDKALSHIWAKTSSTNVVEWHPLVLHMLDVAASADAIICREPATTRERVAAILDMSWEEARPWLLVLIACHDLGKACPGFQCKWKNLSGLDVGRSPDTDVNHAFVSQLHLAELLKQLYWAEDLADLVADAVGCHHGERASPNTLEHISRRSLGNDEWTTLRRELFMSLLNVFTPGNPPTKATLSGPDFMLLSGIASFSDWVGSNEAWFPFGVPGDCEDLLSSRYLRRHQL